MYCLFGLPTAPTHFMYVVLTALGVDEHTYVAFLPGMTPLNYVVPVGGC